MWSGELQVQTALRSMVTSLRVALRCRYDQDAQEVVPFCDTDVQVQLCLRPEIEDSQVECDFLSFTTSSLSVFSNHSPLYPTLVVTLDNLFQLVLDLQSPVVKRRLFGTVAVWVWIGCYLPALEAVNQRPSRAQMTISCARDASKHGSKRISPGPRNSTSS